MSWQEKYKRLTAFIKNYPSAAVAFSGGVDSTLLCRAAADALGDKALAVTVFSVLIPEREKEMSVAMARSIGINQKIIEFGKLDPVVASNPADRCYHCKKIVFSSITAAAAEGGIETVFDGSNVDDQSDYRPGMKALAELKIVSPLKECGLTKADIRDISRELELATWNLPAYACLASRIPYGSPLTGENLSMVEKGEAYLHSLGFRQVRLRHHDRIGRIELAREEMGRILEPALMEKISRSLKNLGYTYVCLELEGYAMGSLNQFDEKKQGA